MKTYRFKEQDEKPVMIGKIICLARTYKKHAQEMKTISPETPLLFLKPNSSIICSGESIIIPSMTTTVHHEVELGVVIGKQGKYVSDNHALDYVLGYLIALDITARDLQNDAKKRGWPWTIAKGFDTFTPIGEIVSKQIITKPNNVFISLRVNGELKQRGNTKDMTYSVEKIIEYISKIMTLERGDLILTGTPEGVGEITDGDLLEAEIENISKLRVDVKKQ